MPRNVPVAFSSYAGMDIGRDKGLVVDRDYEDKAPYAFTGTVKDVVFDPKPAHPRSRNGPTRPRRNPGRRTRRLRLKPGLRFAGRHGRKNETFERPSWTARCRSW